MYFADLHVHTNVSDCSMSAENILKKAKKSGITHIAFTDHDTTQCAFERGWRQSLEFRRFLQWKCLLMIMKEREKYIFLDMDIRQQNI